MANLAETIFEITGEHLDTGGLLLGQNLAENHNLAGTIPAGHPNCQIMPTTELAGCGIAVGCALSGRPTIHVLRFQSFLPMHAPYLVFYAAKARELWNYSLPLFVRASGDDRLGPTHTGTFVSQFVHYPGLTIAAPCTPGEYREVWDWFKKNRQPVIVSEHRSTYSNDKEWAGAWSMAREVTLVGLSNARFAAAEAFRRLLAENIHSNVFTLNFLSPLELDRTWPYLLGDANNTKKVIIADCSYEPCSIAEHIAYRIACETGAKTRVVGMEPRLSGVADRLENGTPSVDRIVAAAKEML